MKKLVYFTMILINLCVLGFSEDTMNVCIILKLSPVYGEGEIEIYNDTYLFIADTMKKIEQAKNINVNFIIKEALLEGEYFITVKKNDIEINSYIVFNSQNIYDMKKEKYLKCNVLPIFIRFLLLFFEK